MIQTYKEPQATQSPWRKDLCLSHPYFFCLSDLWPFADYGDWPSLQDYNDHYLKKRRAQPCWQHVKFVPQQSFPFHEFTYEAAIYFKSLVPTRLNHWHDFFNYLTWLDWPRSKKSLIQRVMKGYLQEPQNSFKKRKGSQNHLARFEECGLVIMASPFYCELIKEHRWYDLFVTYREHFHEQVTIKIYGHSLYEKLLSPYVGLTGFAVLMASEPLCQEDCDERLSECLQQENSFGHKLFLQPFPMLGVPGTFAANQNPDFYLNQQYFRPKRFQQ